MSQFYFNKSKSILSQKSPKILQSLLYTCIYRMLCHFCEISYFKNFGGFFVLVFVCLFVCFLLKNSFQFEKAVKSLFFFFFFFFFNFFFIAIRFYHSYFLPKLNQQNLTGRKFPPTLIIFFFICIFFKNMFKIFKDPNENMPFIGFSWAILGICVFSTICVLYCIISCYFDLYAVWNVWPKTNFLSFLTKPFKIRN